MTLSMALQKDRRLALAVSCQTPNKDNTVLRTLLQAPLPSSGLPLTSLLSRVLLFLVMQSNHHQHKYNLVWFNFEDGEDREYYLFHNKTSYSQI